MTTFEQLWDIHPDALLFRSNHRLLKGPVSTLLQSYLHLLNQSVEPGQYVPITINFGENQFQDPFEVTRGRLYLYWLNLPHPTEDVWGFEEPARSLSLFLTLSKAFGYIYMWTRFPPVVGEPRSGWEGWNQGQQERFVLTYSLDIRRRLQLESPEFLLRLRQELHFWGGSLWDLS